MTLTLLNRLLVSLGCLSGLAFTPVGQAGPLGDAIRVNANIAGNQSAFGLAAGANGEKLLIWKDGPARAVYAQRIRSSGTPFSTKQSIPIPESYSDFSVDSAGNFVLSGQSSLYGVVMAYDRNGTLLSSFKPSPDALDATASMDTDGNITAAYIYPRDSSSIRKLAIRRFTPGGTPIAPEVIVASGDVDSIHVRLSMATDDAGNISLVWTSQASWREPPYSMLQRFSRAGVSLGPALAVNPASTGSHASGTIAMEPGGKSVVLWRNYFPNQPGPGYTVFVYARTFDANGNPTSASTRVNQRFTESGTPPSAAIAENGDFVVSWIASKGVIGGGPESSLAVRQFRSDGTPITNESRVDPPQAGPADRPRLAMDRVGNFSVAWTSGAEPAEGSEPGWDAWVRTFKMETRPPITQLVDDRAVQGLAGDTDSWSYYRLTVPSGVRQLNIDMTGPVGVGDGDMYVRFGGLPSLTAWDQRPYVNGSNESIGISNPPPGDVYIGIHGRSAYSSVGLRAGYHYP